LHLPLLLHSEVVIGLEETSYTTAEDGGSVEVCAVVVEGVLERSAEVSISTVDGSATGQLVFCPFPILSGMSRYWSSLSGGEDYTSITTVLTFDGVLVDYLLRHS